RRPARSPPFRYTTLLRSSDVPVAYAAFVGVDLHTSPVSLCAVDPAGKALASLTCDTKCVERIEQWLLALPRPTHLAVEAVGFVRSEEHTSELQSRENLGS